MVNARRVALTQSSLHTSSSSWVPHFETLCSSRDQSLCSWNDGLCDIFQEQFHDHILLHALCCRVSDPSCLHIFCVQEGFSQCSLRKLRCACDPAAGLPGRLLRRLLLILSLRGANTCSHSGERLTSRCTEETGVILTAPQPHTDEPWPQDCSTLLILFFFLTQRPLKMRSALHHYVWEG